MKGNIFMSYVYLYIMCDINSNAGDFFKQVDLLDKLFSHGESIIAILINLLVAIVGVYGISYLFNMKNRRLNATFSYYSRFEIRLHTLNSILKEYKDSFLDRFIPIGLRHELNPDNVAVINCAIDNLIKTANETLLFLKTEEEQLPASPNWVESYNTLLDFLYDCRQLENNMYFKWRDDYKAKQEEYYNKHQKNIENMINDILICQKELQEKLSKKSLLSKVKEHLKKKK